MEAGERSWQGFSEGVMGTLGLCRNGEGPGRWQGKNWRLSLFSLLSHCPSSPRPPPLPAPQSLLGPQAEMSIFVRDAEVLSLPPARSRLSFLHQI